VETKGTGKTALVTRRLYGKAVSLSAFGMNLGNLRPDFRKMVTDAIYTEPNDI
jgi:hypothetical protein